MYNELVQNEIQYFIFTPETTKHENQISFNFVIKKREDYAGYSSETVIDL